MKIISKAGVEFLVVNLFGENEHLNPVHININKIHYIREWLDDSKNPNASAIFIGVKLLKTNDDVGLSTWKNGETIELGTCKFLCVEGRSLTDKEHVKYLVNFETILYQRKFITKNDNKIDSSKVEDLDNLSKFALITLDGRMLLIKSEVEEC